MEHRYPSKIEVIYSIGYDPKQLHHLLRVEEYLYRYLSGEKYADCLYSRMGDFLQSVKNTKNLVYQLDEARKIAVDSLAQVVKMADDFSARHKDDPVDWHVDVLLDDVQRDIMKLAIELELEKEGL